MRTRHALQICVMIKGEIRTIIDAPRGEPPAVVGERMWLAGSSLYMATHIMLHAR